MAMILALLSLLSIFLVFIFHKHKRRSTSTPAPLPPPPGPTPLPIIGNLHLLNSSSLHRRLWQLAKLHGPLMSLRFGFAQTVVVSSSNIAKEILKTHDIKFASRPSFVGMKKLSYNRLDLGFAPYGPCWREMKKLSMVHLFSAQRVQSFRSVREDEVAQLIQKLKREESQGSIVNLTEALMSFTSSLICRIAFGKKYGCEYYGEVVGNRRSRLQVLLNEAQAVLAEFCFEDYFPVIGKVIDRVRGFTSRLDETFKELDLFYEKVIYDHMDSAKGSEKTNDEQVQDIVDILLHLLGDRSLSFDLTLDHIKAVLMNIFIAGTDPTSATIVWAMTALLKNPDVMKKVQCEMRNLFGDKDFINEDDIERLPYLKAVVKETLRLFPPSPLLLPRETMEQCNINGYKIKSKTIVYVNAWAIARDPENWEEAEKFWPERFIGNSMELKGNEFEVIPFGSGRRMCPAKHMGIVNVELSLANLVHTFDWEVPKGVNKEEMLGTQVKPGITMHKKSDLYLVAKKQTT